MSSLTIWLDKPNKTYHPGEKVHGTIHLENKVDTKQEGITVSLEGILCIQPPPKSSGLLETFVNAPKPVTLCSSSCDISSGGKLKSPNSSFSFSLPLTPLVNKNLYETFHGQCIVIQYILKCDVRKSILEKHLTKTTEILVTIPGSQTHIRPYPISQIFICTPETLSNVRERIRTPGFLIKGGLDSHEFRLHKYVSGSFSINHSKECIKSVDLQLMRIETVKEANIKEISEVQILQIATGDPPRDIQIPICMMLPRFLTCCTIIQQQFSIEFELNLIVTFDNDHKATESFPITIIPCL